MKITKIFLFLMFALGVVTSNYGMDWMRKAEKVGDQLHQAVENDNLDALEALCRENRGLLDGKDSWHRTPLDHAAQKGFDGACKILIKYGATVDAEGMMGETPLFDAALKGHANVCRTLLAAGADVNAKNNYFGPVSYSIERAAKDSKDADTIKVIREALELKAPAQTKAENKIPERVTDYVEKFFKDTGVRSALDLYLAESPDAIEDKQLQKAFMENFYMCFAWAKYIDTDSQIMKQALKNYISTLPDWKIRCSRLLDMAIEKAIQDGLIKE